MLEFAATTPSSPLLMVVMVDMRSCSLRNLRRLRTLAEWAVHCCCCMRDRNLFLYTQHTHIPKRRCSLPTPEGAAPKRSCAAGRKRADVPSDMTPHRGTR